jgi:hypothetical protein
VFAMIGFGSVAAPSLAGMVVALAAYAPPLCRWGGGGRGGDLRGCAHRGRWGVGLGLVRNADGGKPEGAIRKMPILRAMPL